LSLNTVSIYHHKRFSPACQNDISTTWIFQPIGVEYYSSAQIQGIRESGVTQTGQSFYPPASTHDSISCTTPQIHADPYQRRSMRTCFGDRQEDENAQAL
jgi:hypothetical protein